MYQISANLVHRELRNTTFEGKKMPTSIAMLDSAHNSCSSSFSLLMALVTRHSLFGGSTSSSVTPFLAHIFVCPLVDIEVWRPHRSGDEGKVDVLLNFSQIVWLEVKLNWVDWSWLKKTQNCLTYLVVSHKIWLDLSESTQAVNLRCGFEFEKKLWGWEIPQIWVQTV